MDTADSKKPQSSAEQTLSCNEAQNLNVSDELNKVLAINTNNIIQGFIMSQVLERPRALKSRGRNIWNSRF